MAKNDLFCCLMQTDWRELIAPLIVFGIYAVVSILKSLASQPSPSEQDQPPETPSVEDTALREPKTTEVESASLKQSQAYKRQIRQPAVRTSSAASQSPLSPKPKSFKSPSAAPTAMPSTKPKIQRAIPISRATMPPLSAGRASVTSTVMASACPVKPISQVPVDGVRKQPLTPLAALIRDKHTLRRAIVLSEILAKPLALRRDTFFDG